MTILTDRQTDRQTDQIEWINVTKGVAMLMVIWGHVSLSDNIVLLWFTKFHVPTFLILTGLLFAKTSKKLSGCKKTIRKTVIPYLTFSLFAMITDGILNYRMGYAVRVIIVDLYKTITLYGIHALWYLGSYMIAVCVFLIVNERVCRIVRYALYLLFLLNAIVCTKLVDEKSLLIVLPIVSLIRACACVSIIGIGYELYSFFYKIGCYRKLNLTIATMLLVTSFALSLISGESNFSVLDFGEYPIVSLAASILGAVGMPLLIQAINGHWHFVAWLGKNSLILLITHSSLKLTVLSQEIWGHFHLINDLNFGLLCLITVIIMEIPLINLLNGKLNFLISGKINT